MLQKLLPLLLVVCCIVSFSIDQTFALEEWVPIDIEPYSNTKLKGHQWWTLNAGDSTYSRLPIGEVADFEGPEKEVKFQIIDGAIVLFGTNAARWPKSVDNITIGGKAKSIYFYMQQVGALQVYQVISL